MSRLATALALAAAGGITLYAICPWLGATDSRLYTLLWLASTFAYVGGLMAAFCIAFGPKAPEQ